MIGSVLAALISFLVGLIVVTALELGVGKSLSCWVWDECSTTESSADSSAGASTLPSVLGGGSQGAPSSTPQEDSPSNLQQQPDASPGTPGAPSQEAPTPPPPADPSAQPGQRQGPSGVPEKEDQQDQQQSPPGNTPADQQQPPPSGAREAQPHGSVDQKQVSSDPS